MVEGLPVFYLKFRVPHVSIRWVFLLSIQLRPSLPEWWKGMAPAHHLGSKKLVSIRVSPFVEGFCSSAFVIGDIAVCSAVVTASIGSAFQPEVVRSDA